MHKFKTELKRLNKVWIGNMSLTVCDGITIGAVGGILAGLTIWIVKLIKEKIMKEWDKRTVYNWLYQRTKKGKGLTIGVEVKNDPRWVSTSEIACYTNLTVKRVRYICSIHEKIRPSIQKDSWSNEPAKKKWGIRSIVDHEEKK